MSDPEVAYVAQGANVSEEAIEQVAEIARAILDTVAQFAGKPTHIVLNALASAHWTAACYVGEQERTAQALVEMAGSYLAGLELARAAGSVNKPQVH